jgi:hypothetical protein
MQTSPLTYEGILEMFRETDRKFQETDRKFQKTDRKFQETAEQMKETDRKFQETAEQMKETDRKFQETAEQMKETHKKISALGSRIGEIVESMVAGNIVDKFQKLGYDVTGCSPRKSFRYKELGLSGEIDLLLDDGDVAILIEVKTTLETADIREHIERLEKYRRYADARGIGDKRRFIGAVAGAVVSDDAAQFALESGMYVIVQSGEAVEIVTPPEGFMVKEW